MQRKHPLPPPPLSKTSLQAHEPRRGGGWREGISSASFLGVLRRTGVWEREVCVIVIPLNAQQEVWNEGRAPPSLGETAAEWEKGGSLAASLRSERERRRAACGASFSEAVFLFSPLGFSSFPRCCFGKTAKRRENWRGKVFPLPLFTYLVPALGGILFAVLFFSEPPFCCRTLLRIPLNLLPPPLHVSFSRVLTPPLLFRST